MKLPLTIVLKSVCASIFLFAKTTQSEGSNVGIFPGGAANSYASLYLGEEFSRRANVPFYDLFDQAWALSGGTVPAILLMKKGKWPRFASHMFREAIKDAFPDLLDLLDLTDSDGWRRERFEAVLNKYFSDMFFGENQNNRIVFIASRNGAPVFFCDSDFKLPKEELRVLSGTSFIDGIMASSTISLRANLGMGKLQASLFKPRQVALAPFMEKKTVVDGGHCDAKRDGKFILDGSTPTPLVIEYLKSIPGQHNVVVFGNGGPFNEEFRKSINLNRNGTAEIIHRDGRINIFIISIRVNNHTLNLLNKSENYMLYLQKRVEKALMGQSRAVFDMALRAVLQNKSLTMRSAKL